MDGYSSSLITNKLTNLNAQMAARAWQHCCLGFSVFLPSHFSKIAEPLQFRSYEVDELTNRQV
ncbi:hypothetical protein HMPREF3034_01587 [Prevotella sp. DNF00663]|nr:hypothetical protein HMPREF3034_01587 [Prevotella sp. DNF00663]